MDYNKQGQRVFSFTYQNGSVLINHDNVYINDAPSFVIGVDPKMICPERLTFSECPQTPPSYVELQDSEDLGDEPFEVDATYFLKVMSADINATEMETSFESQCSDDACDKGDTMSSYSSASYTPSSSEEEDEEYEEEEKEKERDEPKTLSSTSKIFSGKTNYFFSTATPPSTIPPPRTTPALPLPLSLDVDTISTSTPTSTAMSAYPPSASASDATLRANAGRKRFSFDYDSELMKLTAAEFNKAAKEQSLTKQEIDELKMMRRRFRNRLAAQRRRAKVNVTIHTDKMMMTNKIIELEKNVDHLKRILKAYRKGQGPMEDDYIIDEHGDGNSDQMGDFAEDDDE